MHNSPPTSISRNSRTSKALSMPCAPPCNPKDPPQLSGGLLDGESAPLRLRGGADGEVVSSPLTELEVRSRRAQARVCMSR